ncbi:MAG: hypothetical protein WB817_03860 [Terriglobales bacterium]
MKVSGELRENLQSPIYYIDVELQLDDDGELISYSPILLAGARPWPPTGDYELTFPLSGQPHKERIHVTGETWQQAVLGAV